MATLYLSSYELPKMISLFSFRFDAGGSAPNQKEKRSRVGLQLKL